MKRRIGKLLVTIVALAVAGCAAERRLDAAQDVHALLLSIRDNDRAAFDAHVDRAALGAKLREVLSARARTLAAPPVARGVAVWASGPLANAATSLLVRPEVFHLAAAAYGFRAGDRVPSVVSLAIGLRPTPDGRVCAAPRKRGPCLLTFADEQGTWRLVDVDLSQVEGALRAWP